MFRILYGVTCHIYQRANTIDCHVMNLLQKSCVTVFQHVFDDTNMVLAPVNVSGDHWELLAFYPSVRNIVCVNPLGEKPTRIKATLNAWNAVTKRCPDKVSQTTWKAHTRQQDGHSCGMLVREVSAQRLTKHSYVHACVCACVRACMCVCVTYLRYFTSVFFFDMNSNLLINAMSMFAGFLKNRKLFIRTK